MVNISLLFLLLLSEAQAKYCIDEWFQNSVFHPFDPMESFITGTSYETVISEHVRTTTWIENVSDMGVGSPFLGRIVFKTLL